MKCSLDTNSNNQPRIAVMGTPKACIVMVSRLSVYLTLTLAMAGCSRDDDSISLKLAHTLDQQHAVHKAMVYMNERLVEISDGKMNIDIYPSGQLGSERELMELLQIGSLAMTKVSTSPMEGFVPEMKVFNLPYVFRDKDHFWKVLEGDIGKSLLLAGESVHLRGMAYFDAGSRSFYTNEKPVHKPQDLNGLKIRVQNSQTAIRMVNTLGGSATPVNWGELYTALQQGVVDGAENNPPSFYTSKHYEVSKFYTLDEHTYVPDIMLISTYVWNKLSPQEQDWLQQAMDEAVVFQRQLWEQSTQEALTEVEKAGVEIIRPDKTPFMDGVSELHESFSGTPTGDLLIKIRSIQ